MTPQTTPTEMFTRAMEELQATRASVTAAHDWLATELAPEAPPLTEQGVAARIGVLGRILHIKAEIASAERELRLALDEAI